VMVSRKANCVLGQQGGELVPAAAALSAGRSNVFMQLNQDQERSRSEVVSRYRAYLDAGSGGHANDTHLQEAYTAMRERCLMLTERLMSLEKVAHTVQAQRDALLDRTEKSIELQTRVHDCSVGLEYLDRIFSDQNVDTQSDAATMINAMVRGFLIRNRATKAKRGMQRWRSAQIGIFKAATMRFMAVQRTKDHAVFELNSRRQGSTLTHIVRKWKAYAKKKLPQRQKYRAKYETIRNNHLAFIQRSVLVGWRLQATGKFSSKNVKKSYDQRKRRAELRLISQQEKTGKPPEITDALIEQEVTRDAVETISAKHYARQLGDNMREWQNSKAINTAKAHYNARIIAQVLMSWANLITTIKSSDEQWMVEHQTRVKMRIFFRALQEDVFAAWCYFSRTRREATRRFNKRAKDWLEIVFEEYRAVCSTQHETRDIVLSRLALVARATRSVPFQRWHTLALEEKVWRFSIDTHCAHADGRRRWASLGNSFFAWQDVAFASSAGDANQLLSSVTDLQAANEALQVENLKAIEQAERAVAMGEAQLLQKEQRAETAEETARAAQLELQKAMETIAKMKQQKEMLEAMQDAKDSIGASAKPPASGAAPALEPTPHANDGATSEVSYVELLLLNR
jgi:hypothetical protein